MTVDELMAELIKLDAPEAVVSIVLATDQDWSHISGVRVVRQFEGIIALVPVGVEDPWGPAVQWPPYEATA